MSLGKRILDLARANLNALLEKAAGETTVDDMTDEELEAELARRRMLRQREEGERQKREQAEEAARQRYTQRTGQAPPPKRESRRREIPKTPIRTEEKRLRELYQQLEVPYGAGFDEVKKSFRRLMRKYHPDLHVSNPEKHKVATQLTMSLTQAYNELEVHLAGGRRS
jgi:DnaJ-domain-containing protein 1